MSISTQLPVEIITMNLETATPVEESMRQINFASPSDRKWLEKHMFWATYNRRGIAFNPIVQPAEAKLESVA